MNPRVDEHDLLAWIEGDLAPERAPVVDAALEADPGLRAWTLALRRDRTLLQAQVEAPNAARSGSLVAAAIELAERRALVGADVAGRIDGGVITTGRTRLRLTPVRIMVAAGLLIAVSAATLAPLMLGPTGGTRPMSPPVVVDDGAETDMAIAMAMEQGERTMLGEALKNSETLHDAAAVVAHADKGWENTARVAAPSRATLTQVDGVRAQELLRQGRLILEVRTEAADAADVRSALGDAVTTLEASERAALVRMGAASEADADQGVAVEVAPGLVEALLVKLTALPGVAARAMELPASFRGEGAPEPDLEALFWWSEPLSRLARPLRAPVLIHVGGGDEPRPDASDR